MKIDVYSRFTQPLSSGAINLISKLLEENYEVADIELSECVVSPSCVRIVTKKNLEWFWWTELRQFQIEPVNSLPVPVPEMAFFACLAELYRLTDNFRVDLDIPEEAKNKARDMLGKLI